MTHSWVSCQSLSVRLCCSQGIRDYFCAGKSVSGQIICLGGVEDGLSLGAEGHIDNRGHVFFSVFCTLNTKIPLNVL